MQPSTSYLPDDRPIDVQRTLAESKLPHPTVMEPETKQSVYHSAPYHAAGEAIMSFKPINQMTFAKRASRFRPVSSVTSVE